MRNWQGLAESLDLISRLLKIQSLFILILLSNYIEIYFTICSLYSTSISLGSPQGWLTLTFPPYSSMFLFSDPLISLCSDLLLSNLPIFPQLVLLRAGMPNFHFFPDSYSSDALDVRWSSFLDPVLLFPLCHHCLPFIY